MWVLEHDRSYFIFKDDQSVVSAIREFKKMDLTTSEINELVEQD